MTRTSYRVSKTKQITYDQKIPFVPEVEKGILPLSSKMENTQTTVCGREKEQRKPRPRRRGKCRNTLGRGGVEATASIPTEVSSGQTRDLTRRPVASIKSTGDVCYPCRGDPSRRQFWSSPNPLCVIQALRQMSVAGKTWWWAQLDRFTSLLGKADETVSEVRSNSS